MIWKRFQWAVSLSAALCISAWTHASAQQPCPFLSPDLDTVTRLQRGGLLVLVRHTESIYDSLGEGRSCEEPSRLLSEFGEKEARQIGVAIRTLSLPIGEIFYSPTCRTKRTAELMFPDHELRGEPRLKIGNGENTAWLEKQLTSRPGRGNRFFVTHGTVMSRIRLGGKQVVNSYRPVSGLAAVFDPSQTEDLLMGCLSSDDWTAMRKLIEGPERNE